MKSSSKTIITGLIFLLSTSAVSVLGYVVLADASFLDALFMVVITIFSVGYEETIRVDEPILKAWTIGVIIAGCSSLLYALGGFVQMMTEGEVTRAMNERRNIRSIDALKGHAIVCGYGRMGQILTQELVEANYPFVVIDNNADRVREAEEHGFLVVNGDATDEDTLRIAHIEVAKSIASALPSDAANVFITLSARNMNPDLRILARGELPSTEGKLVKAGADHVVLPATIGGLRLAHMIVRPSAAHLIETLENSSMINDDLEQLGVALSEIEVEAGSPFDGKTVGELEIGGKGAYLIVAVRSKGGDVVRKPSAELVVNGGDTVIVIGHGASDPRFTLSESPAREVVYRGDDLPEGD